MPSTSSPDDLHSVIKAFEPALKSVDVRIVAVKTGEQDKWQNLITSVFLGGKGVEEARKDQKSCLNLALPTSHSLLTLFLIARAHYDIWYPKSKTNKKDEGVKP